MAHTVGLRRAWHDITAFRQHTHWNDVGHGMPSSTLGSTHGQTTSAVACHHPLLAAHTVERHRAWHAIIALGRQTPSNDVKRGMPSSPLGSTNGRTTSGVACHHRLWAAHTVERRWAWHAIIALGWQTRSNDVGRGMPSTHGRKMSGMTCHHRLWTTHTVKRRRARHAIIAFG